MRRIILFLFAIYCLAGCAKIVTPVGGPKDVTPPEIVKEVPPSGQTHFTGNVIKISFNEFVTLENTMENVLVSPPLEHQPTFTLSGKTLTIKILDTLQPDRTYNFGFADCIRDFTEGNPIPYYNYAFSTGDYVDSMQLRGKVTDALTGQPVTDCFVFAYSEDIDSLPLTTRPQFVTKTRKDGSFTIKNIKSGDFKIFALKDINNNLIFDLPNESIAFADECYSSIYIPDTKNTTVTDSTSSPANVDSLKDAAPVEYPSISLQLFTEKDSTQALVKMQNKEAGKYEFFYKSSIKKLQKNFLSDTVPDYWEVLHGDTLTWYLKEPISDTLRVALTVNDTVCDTLQLTPFKGKEKAGRQRQSKPKYLSVSAKNQGELYKTILLQFGYPIRPVDEFEAMLVSKHKYSGNDTSYLKFSVPDSFVMELPLPMKVDEKVVYSLLIRDSVFQGYNGLASDTLKLDFTTKTEKDYGTLRMKYILPDNGFQYLATLSDSKGQPVAVDILSESKELTYNNLLAGNYSLKLIEDRNGNEQWDTGNYRRKLLPERIIAFEKSITIRGYWELEEVFEVKEEKR